MRKLTFIKAFNSPFKRPKLRWYCGKIAIGTPYFYPRKWVKGTPELAHKAVMQYIEREESYNRLNPNYARKIRPYDEVYQEKLGYEYAVPKKIGIDLVGLGWKTKWSDTDYRFEWAPLFSFVFFGYQVAVTVLAPEQHRYWEAWLYYERDTDTTKSRRERIAQCRAEFSLKCTVWNGGTESKVDYYESVLRKKYL